MAGSDGDERAQPPTRLKVACDAAAIGVWEYDVATTLLLADPRCRAMYGWPADRDIISFAAWRDRLHPDDVSAVDAAVAATLGTGVRLDVRFRIIRPGDHSTILVHSTGTPEFDAQGKMVRVIGANRDITEQAAAEAQLRESEARFRVAFDLAPNGMALIALDGVGQRVNAALSRILGYTQAELLTTNFRAITHPDDLPATEAAVARLLAGEIENFSIEKRYFHKSGSIVWTLVSTALVHQAAGSAPYFATQIQDITAQKHTEQALRFSEQRLRGLYEMSQLGFIFGRVEGPFVEVNDAFARMMGYAREELVGTHYRDLTPPDWNEIDREQVDRLVTLGHCGPYEKEFRRRDGSVFPVQATASLITGGGGERYFWVVVEDITERRRQARAQGALAAIVESSVDAIIAMDVDGKITIWNSAAERMLGYTATEAIGQSLGLIIPPDKRAETRAIQQKIWQGERVEQFSTTRLARDGREIPVTLTIWPVLDAQGRIVGGSGVVRDMTERNQIEAQLRQAQKMEAIGNLTGGLAHDFNNLLAVITGNLDLLAGRIHPTPVEKEILADALAAADRGAELTRSLLAFARRQPLQPRIFRLADLVEDTARLLRRLLGEHIEIVTAHDGSTANVCVDPAQLSAALTNLATNARDAMPGGGTLEFRTGMRRIAAADVAPGLDITPGDYAVIEVQDGGRGIPAEIIDRIFEPFFTTKTRDDGTGLGLSMVFGFMKQSGGHVAVASEIGSGTLFTLYLPRVEDVPAYVEPGEPESGLVGRGQIILAVEDQLALRRTLSRQLIRLGYRLVTAGNAAEALQILETQPVDLLFSDVVMPGGIDGFELAHRVRERWPAVKIVLTSGFPETGSDRRLPSLEIPLLGKPYRIADLAALLRRALDNAR